MQVNFFLSLILPLIFFIGFSGFGNLNRSRLQGILSLTCTSILFIFVHYISIAKLSLELLGILLLHCFQVLKILCYVGSNGHSEFRSALRHKADIVREAESEYNVIHNNKLWPYSPID